jgi:hypothetical protein
MNARATRRCVTAASVVFCAILLAACGRGSIEPVPIEIKSTPLDPATWKAAAEAFTLQEIPDFEAVRNGTLLIWQWRPWTAGAPGHAYTPKFQAEIVVELEIARPEDWSLERWAKAFLPNGYDYRPPAPHRPSHAGPSLAERATESYMFEVDRFADETLHPILDYGSAIDTTAAGSVPLPDGAFYRFAEVKSFNADTVVVRYEMITETLDKLHADVVASTGFDFTPHFQIHSTGWTGDAEGIAVFHFDR